MENREIWTVEDVAKYLRVSERTVYEWAQKGSIPCGKIGTVWRFKQKDILRWVDESLNSSDAPTRPSQAHFLIEDVLEKHRILRIEGSCTKQEALSGLCKTLSDSDAVEDLDTLMRKIFYRESLCSTGIGLGCGIPHCRLKEVRSPVMAFGVYPDGIDDYVSLDNEPVKILFLIAASEGQHEEHIKLLSKISELIKPELFRERLLNAKTQDDIWEILTMSGRGSVEN